MRIRNAGAAALISAFVFVACATSSAQSSVANPGFESGTPGDTPSGWFVPQPSLDAGYSIRITSEGAKQGSQCLVIARSTPPQNGFGNVMQSIDATPFRGKRVRFRAAVRFEPGQGFGRAQMWMRVDRAGGQQGFFDNMGDRPISSSDWAYYEISGTIDSDAQSLNFGMFLVGAGRAYLDDVSLGTGNFVESMSAPARALSARGLENLVAYTKLLGYVRHFHPSDGVEKTDWNAFSIAGVKVAEDAKDAADLAQKLETYFRKVAPTIQVFPTGKMPAPPPGLTMPSDTSGLQVVTWLNTGFGGGSNPPSQNLYHSRRVFKDVPGGALNGGPDPRVRFEADLGGGVSCAVPLALWAKAGASFPRTVNAPAPDGASSQATGDDRTTRLADVALCWNVYEHFYPYFDVVKTDWNAALRTALNNSATDADKRAFLDTLRRLVASAKDGHGYVGHMSDQNFAQPPILADWVEGKLVVTQVGPSVTKPRIGDEILKIDGKNVFDLWKNTEPLVSGATEQWRRMRGKSVLLAGLDGSQVSIMAARAVGEPYTLSMTRSTNNRIEEKRPEPITEIKPGIWYVDLDGQRANMDAYKAVIPKLAKAKGIIFDMRGYPNDVAMDVIHRISDKPVISANWNVPTVSKPDHVGMEFQTSHWNPEGPLEPRFTGKIAFLTYGGAISYAESIMGIVENYKLGAIVGEPTAGTNGNVNPFSLPGGYTVVFTGMKVTKHDGSQHHGIGIKPTVPVSRTIQGVIDKRDEVLEKAIAVVGG